MTQQQKTTTEQTQKTSKYLFLKIITLITLFIKALLIAALVFGLAWTLVNINFS